MEEEKYIWNESKKIDNRCNFETYLNEVRLWLNNANDEYWYKMEKRYPTIDIDHETCKAWQWINDHKKRRIKNIKRFFINWYYQAELYLKKK